MIKIIPKRNETEYVNYGVNIITQPSKTHKMHVEKERIYGFVDDDIEAVKQMIYICLNTEKGVYPIYPNFGVKVKDLFGGPKDLAFIRLTRRIEDALMLDDRIEKVYGFEYIEELSQDENLAMKFKVNTIFGSIELEEVLALA